MIYKHFTVDTSANTLTLPQEVLDSLGLINGDEVGLFVVDRTLVIQPLEEFKRQQKIETITAMLFDKRKHVYETLAQGS